ncbi:amino acid adenylation domain-containing protein [Oxalobacteraceae bacterium]|nr:amino acid adenylation domain-containing protein [Oxalobacteraceae bacterium]
MSAAASIEQMRARALELMRGGARAAVPAPAAALAAAALEHADFSHGLTPVQEGIWFQEQLKPGTGDAHIAVALRLQGSLDPERLARAVALVVQRQPALRSRVLAGVPARLQVQPQGAALLALALAPDGDAEAQLLREARRPFDFAHDTLFRAALLPLAPNEHVLLLTAHHLVFDGWSMSVTVGQLGAAYRADDDQAAPATPDGQAYRRWFAAPAVAPDAAASEAMMRYWREALAQSGERLSLPADRAADATCYASLDIDAASVAGFDGACRAQGVTRFPLLAAAFGVVLGRYAQQAAVTVGFPLTVRPRAELQTVAGNFLHTLPLPLTLDADASVGALLAETHRRFLGALAHADVAMADLARHCLPGQDGQRGSVFDALINLTNFAMSPFEAPGIVCTPFSADQPELLGLGGAKFPLTVYCEPLSDGGMRLRAVGMGAHYSAARLALVLHQLLAVLRQCAQGLAQPLASLSLRTEACDAALPRPALALPVQAFLSVPQEFLRMARSQPKAPAVQWRGRQWSYGELASAAAGAAQELNERIGQRGELPPVVAVLGQRCPGVVAATLASWMAGAVVMLLDHTLPAARIATMLETAGATLGIALGDAAFPPQAALTVLRWAEAPGADMDAGASGGTGTGAAQAALSALAASLSASSHDAAYLAFTSGSTGKPKAILGSHNGLAQFLNWQRGLSGIGPGDRVANFTSLSFDVVLRELFLPLTAGATLCIPDSAELGPSPVAQFLEAAQITLLHTVPTLAALWLQRWPETPAGSGGHGTLRAVFFAGEPLSDTVVTRWRGRFPACTVYNLYGPTETTLAKCAARVPDPAPAGIQAIGAAIEGSQALLLAADGRLCGRGELGEIVIRSPYRSHGYFAAGSAQPTFAANPWCVGEGETLYKTGDLGRYEADGQLAILGRRDDQVKINGVRIELAEVRAALQGVAGIADAYVTVSDSGGAKQLVGFAVAAAAAAAGAEASAITAITLAASLRATLPAALVPSRLLLVDELPRNANGKVDRQRLLQAATAAAKEAAVAAPPAACRDGLEQQIHAVWCAALGQGAIAPDCNFFDAGGHSLLLLDVQHRLQAVLEREVAVVHLFQHPTIRTLAAFLEQQAAAPDQAPRAPVSAPARAGAGQSALAARRQRLSQSRQQNGSN